MSCNLAPFCDPVYVTKPLLPSLDLFKSHLEDVWSSHRLTNNGPKHKSLEKRIESYLKVPYASLFNNGTIALIVACQSLRLSGEVITTPFTFAATPHVLTWNNIKPIFCDVNPRTLNIDTALLESLITPQTTAILAVHVFGTPCDVEKIQEIADRYGLRVIYDAAHAFGVEVAGRGIGTFGDISMFSFHATKLFHTAEGGALTYNDANLKPRIDLLKNFGIKNEDEVIMPGINGKMNEIQAALGLLLLDCIEEERCKRLGIVELYRSLLKNVEGISFLTDESSEKTQSCQYLIVKINKKLFGSSRDEVCDELKKYNVFARKYFYPLCSNYACYKHLPSSSITSLPVANTAADEVLSLPLYGDLPYDDVDKICKILLSLKR